MNGPDQEHRESDQPTGDTQSDPPPGAMPGPQPDPQADPQAGPQPGPRHDPGRIHERAPDPAEAANLPLEPKSSSAPLARADEPSEQPEDQSPHHALNTPVGEPDPTADSDPYRRATEEDAEDRASGIRGDGEGAEDD